MTKTIEQIQKENRKFILEAIHGCSYDEALKKEIGFGCDIVVQNYVCGIKDKTEIITLDKSIGICDSTGLFVFTGDDKKPSEIIEIIGKPITLSHLLLALPNGQNGEQIEIELSWFGDSLIIKYHFFAPRKIFWELKKTTLEEQNEETQKELNKLLNGVKICQQ